MRRTCSLVLALVAASGCYASHQIGEPVDPLGCDPAERFPCSRRASPCDALELVDAECGAGGAWVCPPDAWPHEAPPWPDDRCLPLFGRAALFADGAHEAPVPVPIGDRCAWLLPIESDEGTVVHVAVDVARSCDALEPPSSTASVVDVSGAEWVGLSASFVDGAGDARVLARGWSFDPSAPFGVRAHGVGLGRVRGSRVEVDGRWLFDLDLDLGDAAVVSDGFLYAYGCPGEPTWLEEDCIVGRAELGRVDDPAAWSILGEGGFGAGAPRRVFGSGPHRSAVLRDPRGGGFLHVYAIGFGTRLEVQRAPAPEGPWSPAAVLAECELPADDPGAYCAGPVVHLELHDPLRPGEIHVGYAVGTTSPDRAERRAREPEAYWPRIVRLTLP